MTARPICLVFERQDAARAFSRAWAKTGNRMAARMAMIAMTTSSSIRVKALLRDLISNLSLSNEVQKITAWREKGVLPREWRTDLSITSSQSRAADARRARLSDHERCRKHQSLKGGLPVLDETNQSLHSDLTSFSDGSTDRSQRWVGTDGQDAVGVPDDGHAFRDRYPGFAQGAQGAERQKVV